MTALDDRPSWIPRPRQDWWEWHEFAADGWAHLYHHSEIANPRLVMLLPWCLVDVRFPLEHDRPSVSPQRVIPKPGRACPVCAAQNEHRQVRHGP